MSETPDISMDLLEIEDIVPPPETRIVAWARAAFEPGALPSLLMMPGLAPVLSLPGDRMLPLVRDSSGFVDDQMLVIYSRVHTYLSIV